MKKGKKHKASNSPAGDGYHGVWVFGDIRSEAMKKATVSLLHKAGELAVKRKVPLSLILLGRQIAPHLPHFQECGIDVIYFMDHPRLTTYRQETFTRALEHLVRQNCPEIFLFLANDCGRELAPRLAARLQTGLCADCIQLDIDAETNLLLQTVPAFGDHAYAQIITPDKRPQMATVRPGILGASETTSRPRGTGEMVKVPFPKDMAKERVKCISSKKELSSGKAIEEARIVICGGRGMGTGKRFQSLWDLASLIGAEVGATRPAVHAHWIEEERMIGQTGRTIMPELLLLFGISGASQFTASIQQARYIIAINRDPKATVFSVADLGIIGDVKQLLPEFNRKILRVLIDQYGKSLEEICPQAIGDIDGGLGPKIKKLRQERSYNIDEVAKALEISHQDMEKIEENELTPSVSLILRITQLFRVDPAPFLSIAQDARADVKRIESFTKRTQSYSYRTLTPGADHKFLRAFQIIIDPKKDHKMVEYKHEGEEFVYVLKGEVDIKVGEEIHSLKKGDSLHFESSIPHHLRNPSPHKTELIVVLYAP